MDRPQASRNAGSGWLAVSYQPVQFTASSVGQLAMLRTEFANHVPRVAEKIACLLSEFGHAFWADRQLLTEGHAGRSLPAAAIRCAVRS